MLVDRFVLAIAGLAVLSLVVFAALFDPNMRGNERALAEVAIAAALAGAGATIIVRGGAARRASLGVAVALVVGAIAVGIVSFEDLRVDRGNKKAFVALGAAAACGASAITAVIMRRPVSRSANRPNPPAG